MTTYAAKTEVSVSRSRDEIERVLSRWGAHSFGYVSTPDRAAIEFVTKDRRVRFVVAMPDRSDRKFLRTPTGLARTEAAALKLHDQAVRQRWRALLLLVKALLESIEGGIMTFDEAFLPHLVLEDGSTVYETIGARPERLLNTAQLALGQGN